MTDKTPTDWNASVTDLEIDLLLLYFTFSDQHGRVDITSAADYAAKKLGYVINRDPFTIDQRHIDILMDRGIIPDVRIIFNKIFNDPKYEAE